MYFHLNICIYVILCTHEIKQNDYIILMYIQNEQKYIDVISNYIVLEEK